MGTSTRMSDLCNIHHVSVRQDKNSRDHLSCHRKKLAMPSPTVSCPSYKHSWCCADSIYSLVSLCCTGTTRDASSSSITAWDRVFIPQLLRSNSSLQQIAWLETICEHVWNTPIVSRNLNIWRCVLGEINPRLFMASSCYIIFIMERSAWSKLGKTNHEPFVRLSSILSSNWKIYKIVTWATIQPSVTSDNLYPLLVLSNVALYQGDRKTAMYHCGI